MGVEQTPKSTLEKEILLLFLSGFKLATFRSQFPHAYRQPVLAPPVWIHPDVTVFSVSRFVRVPVKRTRCNFVGVPSLETTGCNAVFSVSRFVRVPSLETTGGNAVFSVSRFVRVPSLETTRCNVVFSVSCFVRVPSLGTTRCNTVFC